MHRPRKVWRGRTALAAMSVVSLFTLTACGGNGSTKDDGSIDTVRLSNKKEYLASACPDTGVDLAGKTLTFWSSWTKGEPQQEVLQHSIDCFEKTTGAKVDVQWLGRAALTQNVLPSLSTDKVPDLVDSDVERLGATLIATDAVQSLDDVLTTKIGEGDKTVKDVITPKAFSPQGNTKDGELAMVPTLIFGDAWWYNKALMKDLEVPETIDELFALFDKAKDQGVAAVAQDGDVSFYNAYFFTVLAEQFVGAGGLSEVAQDPTGEAWKNEAGLLESAEIVERLAKGGYLVDGWDAGKAPQIQQGWADGNAAFNFNGTWLPIETSAYLEKSGAPQVEYGSFRMPRPEGATHDVVEAQPAGFSVLNKAKNADVAKAFIVYVLHKDLLRGFPAMTDNITVREDLEVPDKLKDVQQAISEADEVTIFEDGLGSLAAGAYATEVFWPNNDELLRGKITAVEFIEQMAAGSKKFWANQ